MAETSQFLSPQGLDGRRIVLETGESAIATFTERMSWGAGGVTWTINGEASDSGFSVAVDHSLHVDGDDWIPDRESPFNEPSNGVEEYRISRMRFANTGANAVIVILASGRMTVETA